MNDREHAPSVVALGIALGWYTWRLQRRGITRGAIALRVVVLAADRVAIDAGHWDGAYGAWGYEP